ncbi:MAG: hypothetical protein H6657_29670 [Ardenticatenaceae bacterium]|nr:hypothetical protein [Ardenticatenaceae bacterium]
MYARMVTSYVRPNKLKEMTILYKNTVLPLLEHQPGCQGIFVFTNPEDYKEVSVTLWEKLVDMEAFNVNLLALKDKIASCLAEPPDVEIFQVLIPEDMPTMGKIALSEASLGLRIEDPYSRPLG